MPKKTSSNSVAKATAVTRSKRAPDIYKVFAADIARMTFGPTIASLMREAQPASFHEAWTIFCHNHLPEGISTVTESSFREVLFNLGYTEERTRRILGGHPVPATPSAMADAVFDNE